ncbi:MAG: hypothetical protein QW503_06760 [Sulfolobales archaeon]
MNSSLEIVTVKSVPLHKGTKVPELFAGLGSSFPFSPAYSKQIRETVTRDTEERSLKPNGSRICYWPNIGNNLEP